MTTIVIMPGGFHPFHAGHYALYQSAQRAFPDAEVFVAATNDTSARPFPFPVKEKLAKLAGVEAGHFVQVKSPFKAEEITAKFDPNKDVLIFVRSEKDSTKPPQAGGVKRDGSPAYLQPLLGAKKLEPFARHAYMAYLPTVEFGPGMTSATEIRTAWPQLNEKRKTALVMSLYPKTQTSPQLAQTVVKILDAAIGTQSVTEGSESSIQKKIQAKQDSLSLAREQRRARGQRQQGPREIKLQAEIDKLNTELTQLKRQGVAEARVEINQDAPDNLYDIQDNLAMSRWKSSIKNVITSLFAKRYPGVQLFFKNTQDGNLFVTTDKTTLASEDVGLYSDTNEFGASIIGPTAEYGVDDILYVGIGFDSIKSGKYKGIVGEMLNTIVPPLAAKFKAKPAIVIVVEDQSAGAWEAMANKLGWAFISGEDDQGVAEGAPIVVAQPPIHIRNPKKAAQPYRNQGDIVPLTKPPSTEKRGVKGRAGQRPMPKYDEGVAETSKQKGVVGREYDRDPELRQALLYAKQHYPQHANDPEQAMLKWLQRGLNHSEQEDRQHDRRIAQLNSKVSALIASITQLKQQQSQVATENNDYMDE